VKTICYGINNSHEPNFFKVFINNFKNIYNQHIVAHDYIEVPKLVDKLCLPNIVLGRHYGQSKIKKVRGMFENSFEYIKKVPYFDISISHGNPSIIHTSKLRSKLSITFTDNEINHLGHYSYFPFVDFLITPKAISKEILISQGARKDRIFQYDGYKEQIYIADYIPDKKFLSTIPFGSFVTLRPEALKNIYTNNKDSSIVPELLRLLNISNINVLYLPRYESDRAWAENYDNIFIPPEPINGLDACFYSDAVLTGAGTFSREAACLGTPAISFFPGKTLLSVDRDLILKGKVFHSRNPREIIDFVKNSQKKESNILNSNIIKNQVLKIVEDCIDISEKE